MRFALNTRALRSIQAFCAQYKHFALNTRALRSIYAVYEQAQLALNIKLCNIIPMLMLCIQACTIVQNLKNNYIMLCIFKNKVRIITPIHNVMYFKKSDLWQSPEAQDFVPRALMPTHNIAPMHNFMPIHNIIPIHYIMYQKVTM